MSCDVPAARAPLVTCERQSVHEGFPRATAWVRHAFPMRRSCQDPFVCLWALTEKTVASSFSRRGMCRAFSRAHVAIVEANTCQRVMFVLANWP